MSADLLPPIEFAGYLWDREAFLTGFGPMVGLCGVILTLVVTLGSNAFGNWRRGVREDTQSKVRASEQAARDEQRDKAEAERSRIRAESEEHREALRNERERERDELNAERERQRVLDDRSREAVAATLRHVVDLQLQVEREQWDDFPKAVTLDPEKENAVEFAAAQIRNARLRELILGTVKGTDTERVAGVGISIDFGSTFQISIFRTCRDLLAANLRGDDLPEGGVKRLDGLAQAWSDYNDLRNQWWEEQEKEEHDAREEARARGEMDPGED